MPPRIGRAFTLNLWVRSADFPNVFRVFCLDSLYRFFIVFSDFCVLPPRVGCQWDHLQQGGNGPVEQPTLLSQV